MTDPAAEPEALVDFAQFDDTQMRLLNRQVREEINRRDLFAAAPQMLQDVLTTYQGDQGAPGDPWVQPQGALTSYPSGWEVAHGGKVWRSLVSGNVWEPGVSGWREQVPGGSRPTGVGAADRRARRLRHGRARHLRRRGVVLYPRCQRLVAARGLGAGGPARA